MTYEQDGKNMINEFGKLRGAPVDAGPCRISSERYDWLNQQKYRRDLTKTEIMDFLAYEFYHSFGYNLDFEDPRTYNEKMNWLKVFYNNPKMRVISDKSKFQAYVRTRLPDLANHCVVPLAVFHSPRDLTEKVLERLPDKFVLKSNFGSGAQEFVDKERADLARLRASMARWLDPRSNHYFMAMENGYKDIIPAVVCEPVIDFEYKLEIFCFDGAPLMYWIVQNDKTKNVRANLYDMNGGKLPLAWHYPNFDEDPPCQQYFDELVGAAKALSSGFPHVRVDFYAAKNTWYFSEMTFYTWAALTPMSDYSRDVELGRKLGLEKMEG